MSDGVVLDGELSLTNQLDGQGGVYSRYELRGYSAYEIAVQHGYTGTEEEWLVSLHGADGTDGKDGQDGDDYVITEQDYQNIANLVPVPEVPVEDVQINGTSILSNGVANVPVASTSALGVVKVNADYGLNAYNGGLLTIASAKNSSVKDGANGARPITCQNQHLSTFYGLAKAAGHDEKNSTLPIGQYTEEAKTAIRTMLGLDKDSLVAEIRDALGL